MGSSWGNSWGNSWKNSWGQRVKAAMRRTSKVVRSVVFDRKFLKHPRLKMKRGIK